MKDGESDNDTPTSHRDSLVVVAVDKGWEWCIQFVSITKQVVYDFCDQMYTFYSYLFLFTSHPNLVAQDAASGLKI